MPVIPFIPAIIGAGAGIGGALIGKSASDNATEAESEAADKAVALTKEMYEQDRADYAPYRNLGAYSVGQLGHLTGMPSDFGQEAVADATQPRTAQPRVPPTQEPMSLLSRMQSAAERAEAQRTAAPEFQSLRDLGARQQSSSSFVRMRAPDGEEADIDPREVQMFERAGAQRLA